MTTLYKLTDPEMRTYGEFQWRLGVAPTTLSGEGTLCGPGWYHFYTDPLLAVVLNPVHADIANPRLFSAQGMVGMDDHGIMVGCRTATLDHEIDLPVITITQRVAFGILCALDVGGREKWRAWAADWLSGRDRSAHAAWAAAEAEAPADAAWAAVAAAAAGDWRSGGDRSAAVAAKYPLSPSRSGGDRSAAWAAWAAWAAALAAAAAARAKPLNLRALLRKAMEITP